MTLALNVVQKVLNYIKLATISASIFSVFVAVLAKFITHHSCSQVVDLGPKGERQIRNTD